MFYTFTPPLLHLFYTFFYTDIYLTFNLLNMANFKICVRRMRKDGFYPVYIRVSKGTQVGYIRSDKLTTDEFISKSGDITDPFVLEPLTRRIREYGAILNHYETEHWSIKQIVDTLTHVDEDVSFSAYAVTHIDRMFANGQRRTCNNYRQAVGHLERYLGTNDVRFSQMTLQNIRGWMKTLESTSRAKEQYPICIRQIYRAALIELNDEDNDYIRIKNNPWPKIKIPHADTPDKRAISAEDCRRFFSAPLPESKMRHPLPEIGRDVAMLCLCLAGMNTVDIFNLRKKDFYGGVLHYCRAKTTKFRSDNAYMEMRVPSILLPIFERYRTDDDDEYLFNFHCRFSSSDSFGSNVNSGIKKVCESMNIPTENQYCVYTFRHTWATTAQNDVGASFSEVGFALNHSQHHEVTRGYVKIDFSPAWELNDKVIDFIFFSDMPSKLAGRMDSAVEELQGQGGMFRISPKMLIRAAAFFQGKCLHSFEDIGYSNVDQVIAELVRHLPDTIPLRSMVQFKIVNLDNDKVAMYERMKGKGF